jgi:drug/metabolite transporter (DMT)-like permease
MTAMRPREWAMLILLSVIWGGSFFFIELALRGFQPFGLVFLRVAIAASILTVVVHVSGRRLPSSIRTWASLAVMGAINNAIPFSLIAWGQTRIDSGIASILNATTPIFAVLLAHLLTSDERLTVNRLCGVIVGFLGVFILFRPQLAGGFSWQGLGQTAVLGAAISYSLAGIYGKRFKTLSPVVTSAGMLICSSILILPVALLSGALNVNRVPPEAAVAVGGLAVISTAAAYLLYFRILSTAGATNVLLVTFLIPVSAILLGVGVLGEVLQLNDLAGMACIFTGLAIIDGRVLRSIRHQIDSWGRQRSLSKTNTGP